MNDVPVNHVAAATHRLIASHWPPIGVFDEFATPEQAKAAMVLEGWTNDRLELPIRRLLKMPDKDIAVGPGAHYAMAAFLHGNEFGSRFNGPELGAWYASFDISTAIAETIHHHVRRLETSAMGFWMTVQMRELLVKLDTEFHDIRGLRESRPELYHLDDYSASQPFGESLRAADANGICYDSVRTENGTNVVIYRPPLVCGAIQGDHYQYEWSGSREPAVAKLSGV